MVQFHVSLLGKDRTFKLSSRRDASLVSMACLTSWAYLFSGTAAATDIVRIGGIVESDVEGGEERCGVERKETGRGTGVSFYREGEKERESCT